VAVVVSDTSPVRAFAHLGRLDILPALFGEVLIPPAVVAELAHPIARFKAVDVAGLAALKVQTPRDQSQVDTFLRELDRGESEALALALEVGARSVLMDESAGRAVAVRIGLRPIGVIGILRLAKQDRLVPQVRPSLDRLINEISFFVAADLRERVLRDEGEWTE
jgi:predicted nucleic acid-binding protein